MQGGNTMKTSIAVIAACAALSIPIASHATPIRQGPYASFFAGVSGVASTDADVTDFTISPVGSFKERVKFDPSINIGGTGGYDFGIVRLEGEVSYKQGEITSVTSQNIATGTTSQFVDTDGRLGALAVMFNSFIDLHNYSPITPYIGGGIGFAALHLDDTFGTNISVTPVTRGIVYFHDDETVFAYQVGGGFDIALNRRLSLDLGYRYFATSKAHFESTPIATGLKFESHNGSVGLRVRF
jgi:opacity protein-like surface antigen